MDLNQVIERVAQEVKSQLAGQPTTGAASGSAKEPVQAGTLVGYTRAVAGFNEFIDRLVAEPGARVTLVVPQYGVHSLALPRLRDKGVLIGTAAHRDGQLQLPADLAKFRRLLLPGLHRVAAQEQGGLLDRLLARARSAGVPMIALHESQESASPPWLPAGVQWLPLASFGGPTASGPTPAELAGLIDHTLLKAESTETDVRQLCSEAATWHFASVCVNPTWVKLSAQLLKGSGVMVCTVIGFPLGATDAQTKADETRHAVANGADEIDMVLNVGAMKSKDYATVARDIAAVVKAAGGKTVKVILETAHLDDEEKAIACCLSVESGAHFVKTSTGFGPGGATVKDIALMRRMVGPTIGVKASGGIRDTKTALAMVAAGASRVGASASISIVKGQAPAGGAGY